MRLIFSSALALLLSTGISAADPDAVEICLYEEEDWAATLAACNEALAASSDPIEQGRFMLHRALAQEELGNLETALLDQILVGEYRPDGFRGFANAAYLAFDLDDLETEARMAQAAIDAEPDNPRAYLNMLVLTIYEGEPGSCEPYADQVISLLPHPIDWAFDAAGDSYLLGNLGYCLQLQDRNEEAFTAYRAAEYMGLDEHWFFYNFAHLAYWPMDDNGRAVELASRALSFDDPDLENAHILVSAQVFLGDLDAALTAERDYSMLLDQDGLDYGTRNGLGWGLFLAGRIEEAAEVMERWEAALSPEHPVSQEGLANTWDTVAHIRAGLGDAEGALEAFARSIEEDTEELIAHRLQTYRREMTELGIEVPEGEAGLMTGLAECVAMGPGCRLFFDDDEPAQAALAAEASE